MKHRIKYVGGSGEVNLSAPPFIYQGGDIFDMNFDIIMDSKQLGFGGFVSTRSINPVLRTLEIGVVDKRDFRTQMDVLMGYFSHDYFSNTLGRLYINDCYVECIISSSEKEDWNKGQRLKIVTITFAIPTPLWVVEERFEFVPDDLSGDKGFSFPTSFPLRFIGDVSNRFIDNESTYDTPALIEMYGPTVDPYIFINNNVYRVYGELLESERIEIDQRKKTIVKITKNGEVINVFNNRDKQQSPFVRIPSGESKIINEKNILFAITLFHERSEPDWI